MNKENNNNSSLIVENHDDPYIYKLEGHNSSVNTIALKEYENELISLNNMVILKFEIFIIFNL